MAAPQAQRSDKVASAKANANAATSVPELRVTVAELADAVAELTQELRALKRQTTGQRG